MIFTEFLRFFYPSWRSGTKSTYGLPFWEKSGKCRVQVNPRDPNFGQFWSTPGTQNWPKSGSDLMGHYQGAWRVEGGSRNVVPYVRSCEHEPLIDTESIDYACFPNSITPMSTLQTPRRIPKLQFQVLVMGRANSKLECRKTSILQL